MLLIKKIKNSENYGEYIEYIEDRPFNPCSVLRTPGVILQFLEIIRFINIMSVTAW